VEPPPPATAADIRAPAPLPPTTSPAFRALSYNILADQYASSDYAQKVLFKYCPLPYLDYEYRKQLVLAELARYSPDVACLQEVDDKALHEYLAPQLGLDGFSGRWVV
jgi:2',5'-phosphodiesterase